MDLDSNGKRRLRSRPNDDGTRHRQIDSAHSGSKTLRTLQHLSKVVQDFYDVDSNQIDRTVWAWELAWSASLSLQYNWLNLFASQGFKSFNLARGTAEASRVDWSH